MYKVGIIGFGKMGRIRANAVIKSGIGKISAVFDTNPVETEFPIAGSPDAIITNPEIDAVFICTPNYLIKRLTIQSLNAGKHVFCEKPPAFSAAEVEEIRTAETLSGKVLMYGFNHRHHGSIKHMKTLLNSGEYGKILWMRGRYGKSVDKTFYQDWRSNKELAGGGILMDQGIHMVDLFLHFAGDGFDNVQAVISNLYWQLDVEDNVFATLQNSKTGVVASLHSTMSQWRHLFSLEIFLEKGYMVLNGLKTSSNTYGEEILTIAKNRSKAPMATWEDEERITYHTDHSWISEIREFFNAIDECRKPMTGNSNDALILMKTIDNIYNAGKLNG